MTYLNRRRKDGKPKPREIRCKSGRNVVDADAMVAEIVRPRAVAPGADKARAEQVAVVIEIAGGGTK